MKRNGVPGFWDGMTHRPPNPCSLRQEKRMMEPMSWRDARGCAQHLDVGEAAFLAMVR